MNDHPCDGDPFDGYFPKTCVDVLELKFNPKIFGLRPEVLRSMLNTVFRDAMETIDRIRRACSAADSQTSRITSMAQAAEITYECCEVNGRICQCRCETSGGVTLCTPLPGCPPCEEYFYLATGTRPGEVLASRGSGPSSPAPEGSPKPRTTLKTK
jgi:hypothetical protein